MTRSTLIRIFPTLEPTLISIIRPPIRFDASATGVDVDIDALTDAQLDAADTALGAPAAAAASAAAVDGAPDEFSSLVKFSQVDGAPDEFSLPAPPAPPPSRNESVDSVDLCGFHRNASSADFPAGSPADFAVDSTVGADALTDARPDAQAEAADKALDTALGPEKDECSLPVPPAPPPSRSDPLNVASVQLLVVADVIPRKNLGVVLRALGAARGRGLKEWTLRIAGSLTADAAHAAELNALRIALGLHSSQVEWLGDVDEARLATLYREARLLLVPSHLVPSHCEHVCMAAQEAAFFGVPVLAFDVGEFANFGVLVTVADEGAFTAELERLLREPARLDAMRRAARASAAPLHKQLRSTAKVSLTEEEELLDTALRHRTARRAAPSAMTSEVGARYGAIAGFETWPSAVPSVRAAVGEFRALLHLAIGRRAAAERLEARARWREHLRWSRGPVLLGVSVQIALLVVVRIRSEASALDILNRQRSDVALVTDAVPGAQVVTNGTHLSLSAAYAIALAALPAALAFGVPFASSVWIWLPLRLTQRPPLHVRPWAVSALCVGSALSVVATHTLQACLASAAPTGSSSSDVGVPASFCTHSLCLWTRNPINVSTIVVAGYARSLRSRTRLPA